ncbi:MAG: YkgJ family cysteine cluster protein [Bdellovibrionales bacterium]
MIDKDRPSTWKRYDSSFCTTCVANCCRMPVEVKLSDLIRLGLATQDEADASIKKLAKRLMREGFVKSYREGTEFFMLTQRSNDDCYFLDPKTRLCTVYEKRPETCRSFPSMVGPRIGYCPSEKKGT